MAIYDYRCTADTEHEPITEFRSMERRDETPPACPTCQGATKRVLLYTEQFWRFGTGILRGPFTSNDGIHSAVANPKKQFSFMPSKGGR